jgi:glutamate/tyrosine decarboxylase-like PLP-dependent enzyme
VPHGRATSAYGTQAFGSIVDDCCALAQHLAEHVRANNRLELLAPAKLNIVCFGINGLTDAQTADLVADLQEEGKFAPSTTTIGGRLAIRAAIVTHCTTVEEVDALAAEIFRRARRMAERS